MSHKREFEILFGESGLTQSKLAALLGMSRVTVNRWFVDRADALEPPPYAVQFLRVYVMLPPHARERVPAWTDRKDGDRYDVRRPYAGNEADDPFTSRRPHKEE